MIELPPAPAWMRRALCAGDANHRVWFPQRGDNTDSAKQICRRCPVQQECLDYALANGERFGIWGGLSERGRRQLIRQRNKEKAMTQKITVQIEPTDTMRPGVKAIIDAALATLAGDKPAFACRHILFGAEGARCLCAGHPALGLMCERCFRDHAPRHGDDPHCMLCDSPNGELAWQELEGLAPLSVGRSGVEALLAPARVDVLLVLCPVCRVGDE